MKTVEELRATMEQAHRELQDIEQAENEKRATALVGRAFKYRNSYSLPQSDANYWWMYAIVTGQDGGVPMGLTFQRDKDGLVTIEHDARVRAMWPGRESGWTECTHAEARHEWEKIQAQVRAAVDRAFLVSAVT
jgi:hypothetical protein